MDEDQLLRILELEPERSFTFEELMRRAGISAKKEKSAKRALKAFAREGKIEREAGRRFRWSRAGATLDGRVSVDRRGVAYFVADSEPKGASGIPFLTDTDAESEEAIETLQTLSSGDRVRVKVVALGARPRSYARLTEVLARQERRYVGLFQRMDDNLCIVELDQSPSPQVGQRDRIRDISIPPAQTMGAIDGELVEVVFDHDVGRVVQRLGLPGERETEMRKLLLEHGLDRTFPEEVEAQAAGFGDAPSEEDYRGRRDVRHLPLVTIDGATAKDFDDAVCAIREGEGRYRLFVAIADVSHYVRIGTPLDEEAYRRGTSTYLTDRAIPMLPEKLSNGLCSLNPEVDRLCMLADMSVSASGRILDASFSRAVMRSKARLTYEQVASALEGEAGLETKPVLSTLLLLSSLAAKLLERRLRRGSLDLDLPEPVVEFDAEGDPTTATRRPRNAAHRLIEDLMIATNEAAARFFLERRLETLFRIHEKPDPDKILSFSQLCFDLGIEAKLSERPSPGELSQLLLRLSEHPQGRSLHSLLLRALSAARYSPDNEGHFGLASENYLHFTSPIRRYPDLVVHRLMKRAIDGGAPWYSKTHLQKMGDDCSQAERRAMMAERASMELDRALIARRFLGDRLVGNITGIQAFGLFVATLEPFIEGMIPVQSLPDDFYEADPHGSVLVGTRRGHRFALGDPLEVEVVSVNLARRQVELRLHREDRKDANVVSQPPQVVTPEDFEPRSAAPSERLDPKRIAQKLGLPPSGRRGRGGRGGRRGRGRTRPRR